MSSTSPDLDKGILFSLFFLYSHTLDLTSLSLYRCALSHFLLLSYTYSYNMANKELLKLNCLAFSDAPAPASNGNSAGGFRSVAAPVTKPRPDGQPAPTGPPQQVGCSPLQNPELHAYFPNFTRIMKFKGQIPFSSTCAVRVFWHFLPKIEYWVTLRRPLGQLNISTGDPSCTLILSN